MDDNKVEEARREDKCQMTAAEERSEYFKKLEKWLHEAYAWQSVAAMFPYYLMCGQMINSSAGAPSFATQAPPGVAHRLMMDGQDSDPLRQRRPQAANVAATPPFQLPGAEGLEYRIPPIWKRCVAECIDATMLYLLKFSIAFFAIDVFDFRDIDDLDVVNLRIDKMALELTYGILVLEVIHRVIVFIFEAYWLRHGMYGLIGGSTPGKFMMGLKVVQCRNVTPVDRPNEPDVVIVSPGTDLGTPLALGRSLVKTVILGFLFPVCFALFFFRFNIFRYNRTIYDLLCNTIVVEDSYRNLNNNNRQQ